MANRLNFSNDTLTASKFVEIGRKSVDLRTKLGRFGLLQSNNDTNSSITGIEQIANDNVITPEEKKLLAQEWEHIKAAYSSTVSTVNGIGVAPEELGALQSAYKTLESIIGSILSDMNSPYQTDGRLSLALEAYESAAKILQNWINAYNNSVTSGISSYRLSVDHSPVSPTLDDTIVFIGRIYIDGVDQTEELIETYKDAETGLAPDLFQWSIEGTKDDETLMESVKGKQMFSVKASDMTGDVIKAYFAAELNVG